MAGYFRKLNGHVYNGEFTAAEKLQNGVFVEITTDGVKKITGTKDTILRVADKTTLWGMDALVLDVVTTGNDEVFFVENEWDINDNEDYDTAKYECEVGAFVKMRRPTVGDQLIMTVENTLYSSLNTSDMVQPAANGTVAKKVG